MTDDAMTGLEAKVYGNVQEARNEIGIGQVFAENDMSDLNSNTYEFPIPVDEGWNMETVDEDQEMPRSGDRYET